MIFHHLTFIFMRGITYPFAFLPYPAIHFIGNTLGLCAYYLLRSFRKRTLSNLSLASDLKLSEKELIQLAKESFQNLTITMLEYPKLSRDDDIQKIAYCQNPDAALHLLKEGKGVIFFCGHQANWEILFLEGTSRMPGVAIGRPTKNIYLYDWILSIREKFGGKIIAPQNAIREGMRALKQQKFLGIVGDQGMPDSGFSSPFFGRRAWTSPIPAILSYKTSSPIMVATTLRENGKYLIHYSDPIWPDSEAPMESEIERMMGQALFLLEESIKKAPGQWLWQHNRWKQQTPYQLKPLFRQEAILIILPEEEDLFEELQKHIHVLRELYPFEFITIMVPKARLSSLQGPLLAQAETMTYQNEEDLLVRDFRFKLVFNFTNFKRIKPHYLKLSAFSIITLKDLTRLAKKNSPLPLKDYTDIFNRAMTDAT